jgi:hypothetical protein
MNWEIGGYAVLGGSLMVLCICSFFWYAPPAWHTQTYLVGSNIYSVSGLVTESDFYFTGFANNTIHVHVEQLGGFTIPQYDIYVPITINGNFTLQGLDGSRVFTILNVQSDSITLRYFGRGENG